MGLTLSYASLIQIVVWLTLSVIMFVLTSLLYVQCGNGAKNVLCGLLFSFGLILLSLPLIIYIDVWLLQYIVSTIVTMVTLYFVYKTVRWLYT